jgi:hypothetical protein
MLCFLTLESDADTLRPNIKLNHLYCQELIGSIKEKRSPLLPKACKVLTYSFGIAAATSLLRLHLGFNYRDLALKKQVNKEDAITSVAIFKPH